MFVEDPRDESYSVVVKPRFKCFAGTLVFEISSGGQKEKELQLFDYSSQGKRWRRKKKGVSSGERNEYLSSNESFHQAR